MQEPAACLPSCRAGFTCVSGQCVSSCNPPCGQGQTCTAGGECVVAVTSVPVVTAESLAFESGAHRHDGFMVRMTLGPAGGGVGVDPPGNSRDVGLGGGGIAASIDVGGSRGDNFALFGRLRIAQLTDPSVWIDDRKVTEADATTVSLGLIGGGFSYYLMPLNMYLGAAAGLSVLGARFERDNDTQTLNGKVGFGMDFEIGKEWWIADDWGLGAALRVSFGTMQGGNDLPDDTQIGAGFIAALLSATYQ